MLGSVARRGCRNPISPHAINPHLSKVFSFSIDAPTDAQAARAVELAESFAASAIARGFTVHDIELCKKAATCAVDYFNQ